MENGLLSWAGQGNPADKDVDVQIFTSSGTWVKPANALWTHVALSGGGCGGGAGRKGVARSALLDGNGLSLSGGSADTADAAIYDITGDIEIIAYIAPASWTPSNVSHILGKWAGAQQSYLLALATSGALTFYWTTTGGDVFSQTSNATTGFAAGTARWVRGTMQPNNGSGQRVHKFYTSTDGTNWTQLGTTITTTGAVAI